MDSYLSRFLPEDKEAVVRRNKQDGNLGVSKKVRCCACLRRTAWLPTKRCSRRQDVARAARRLRNVTTDIMALCVVHLSAAGNLRRAKHWFAQTAELNQCLPQGLPIYIEKSASTNLGEMAAAGVTVDDFVFTQIRVRKSQPHLGRIEQILCANGHAKPCCGAFGGQCCVA